MQTLNCAHARRPNHPALRGARGSASRRLTYASLSLLSALCGLLLTSLGGSLITLGEARAEKPLVLLVPVVSSDRVTSSMRTAFDQHMRQQLKENPDLSAKVSLVDLETTQAKIKEVGCGAQCVDTRSIVGVAKAAEVRFIFVTQVDNEDEIFSIKMRLFDGALKKLYKSDEESCEFCNEDEVKDKLTRALTSAGFLKALSTPGPEPVKEEPPPVFPLKVIASPVGAQITINGGELGPAPLQVNLDPGVYKVGVALKGYLSQEREFKTPEQAPKEPITMSFTLKPEPPQEFQVTLQSAPPGALVYLDGEQLEGVSPITLKVKPGPHSARFELKGYELGNQSFTTPDHPKDLLIEQTLTPTKEAPTEPSVAVTPPVVTPPVVTPPVVTPPTVAPNTPAVTTSATIPPPPSLLSGGTAGILIGTGIIATGLGAWLVFIHGEVTCDDGRGRLECPTINNTRGFGAPLLGLGAISLGAGVMGALVRSEWPSAPLVAPAKGGGSVSWSFEF